MLNINFAKLYVLCDDLPQKIEGGFFMCDGCYFQNSFEAYNFDICRRCLEGGLKGVLKKSDSSDCDGKCLECHIEDKPCILEVKKDD